MTSASCIDTVDNRQYVQQQRLWLIGEYLTQGIIQEQPSNIWSYAQRRLEDCRRALTNNPPESGVSSLVEAPPSDVSSDVKDYLQRNDVAYMIEEWLQSVLDVKPPDVINFSQQHFRVRDPDPHAPDKTKSGTSQHGSTAAPKKASCRILIAYYSAYGHTATIANCIAKGAEDAGAIITMKRFGEILTPEEQKRLQISSADVGTIPEVVVSDFGCHDAIVFGFPTRFGEPPAQVSAVMEGTGQLWQAGALSGRVGAVFTSTADEHSGQETTIVNFHRVLMHHGMVVMGMDPKELQKAGTTEVQGCTPYGMSTITDTTGQRLPSSVEMSLAEGFGKRIAETTAKIVNR